MKNELKTEIEKIAYNCKRATLLIEKKQSIELSNREKLELKLHLAGCYICRVYEQQSILINGMISRLLKDHPTDIMLDHGYKQDLKKRINEKINSNS